MVNFVERGGISQLDEKIQCYQEVTVALPYGTMRRYDPLTA